MSARMLMMDNHDLGFLTPVLYYTNVWHSQHMPMSSRLPYDNLGKVYNTSRILNHDNTINKEAYDSYSPLYLSCVLRVYLQLSMWPLTAS